MYSWKDFIEKKAQLFPGQGYDSRTGSVTLPGSGRSNKKRPQRLLRETEFPGPPLVSPYGMKNVVMQGSGSGSGSFGNDQGTSYVTPMMARKNVYREAADRAGKSTSDADSLAEEDMTKAQKARHAQWKLRFPDRAGSFMPDANYTILPHEGTYSSYDKLDSLPLTFAGSMSRKPDSHGTVNDKIPIYGSGGAETLLGVPKNGPGIIGGVNVGNLGRLNRRTGGIVPRKDMYPLYLHEGIHTYTPSPYKGETTYWGKEDFDARPTESGVSGYASGPSEELVGIGSEKARMRVNGDDGSYGMGSRWAKSQLEGPRTWKDYAESKGFNAKKFYSPELDDEFESQFGEDSRGKTMNVKSLRHILFELHDKANSPSATEQDKKNYDDFMKQLDYYFEVAKKTGNRRNGDYDMANFA